MELPRAVAEYIQSGVSLNKFIKDRVFKAQAYPNLLRYAAEKHGKTHANLVGIINSQIPIINTMSTETERPRDLNAHGDGPAMFYIGTVVSSSHFGCRIEVAPSTWPHHRCKGVWPGIPTGSRLSVLELLQEDEQVDSLLNDGEYSFDLGYGYTVSLEIVEEEEVETEGGMELEHHQDLDAR